MLDYNIENNITLFRISSDIIPFATSAAGALPWDSLFRDRFLSLGEKIRRSGMRVSMHPGQYTVLNSPKVDTVKAAAAEIDYHARFLDCLGVDEGHKIIIHIGGVYGDKKAALGRFTSHYSTLSDKAKARVVIENDDTSYHIGDVLEIGVTCGIPVVFDTLHHTFNPCSATGEAADWIAQCAATWKDKDGRQKIHYSQQDPTKKAGSHALSIALDPFLDFFESLDTQKPDIMLEVKDKNISARKCILGTARERKIGTLETEWGRYKYLVLERAPEIYTELRALLKDKAAYPAIEFFHLVEKALTQPLETGAAVNGATHIWGYFKRLCTDKEKAAFLKHLEGYGSGTVSLGTLKRFLYKLSEKYEQTYLLASYYFVEPLYTV